MVIRGLTSDEREYEAENWGRLFHAGLLEASFGCHTQTLFVDGSIGETVTRCPLRSECHAFQSVFMRVRAL
jgi:hypothetical protein